ncbi:MAG: Glu-tRNA(Gln) amidotransferase subunit GatD [Nanoarchaeota archaeon]
MNAKEGDCVRVICKDESIEGVLLPSKEDFITLKLSSGYNLGIERSRIVNIELLQPKTPKPTEKKPIKVSPNLPTISILHTGGTIASKVDYDTGSAGPHFTPEDLLEMFPELSKLANIRSRLVASMWSQDMRFSHYNFLAKEVEREIAQGADGIIIPQGTDYIHYTAAALSFIFESLPIPILIVGAQRSSDRGGSDAALNLLSAIYFMTKTDFAEVGVCMHAHMSDSECWILPGTKCRKMHTSRRDAFRPINEQAWAYVNFLEENITWVRKEYKKKEKKKPVLKLFKDNIKVGLLKTHPNMFAEEFSFFEDYDGLVLEASGLGCLPITEKDEMTRESGRIKHSLSTLLKKGIAIVEAPQTLYGRINMNVYDDQRIAQEMGILGHLCDMTPETAFIKLAWLLSNYKKDKIKELYEKNLRGEISDRSTDYFLV